MSLSDFQERPYPMSQVIYINISLKSKFLLQSDPQQELIQRQDAKDARMLHTNFDTNIHAHE